MQASPHRGTNRAQWPAASRTVRLDGHHLPAAGNRSEHCHSVCEDLRLGGPRAYTATTEFQDGPQALGVRRSWACLCGLDNLFCPFHLALEHMEWLKGNGHFESAGTTPLYPTAAGTRASKTAVVSTYEAHSDTMGQPLHDESGLRLFGQHTTRVTGSQVLAAAGIEVNKIRILARHSGEAILRCVADARRKSLRADLGLGSLAGGRLPDPSCSRVQSGGTSAQMRARIQ